MGLAWQFNYTIEQKIFNQDNTMSFTELSMLASIV